jgi:polysaccharide export outer membrane protein
MRRFLDGLLAGCLVLGAGTGALAQVPAAGGPPAAVSVASLRPGDAVKLLIWREPDLSGSYTVDEKGLATLPLLGTMPVAGVNPEVLRAQLLEGYRRYLLNPSIEVVFMHRVRILGAVLKPGLYPVDATMTVADALALAGGPTEGGSKDKVDIVRDGQRVQTDLRQDTPLADTPLQSGDQIFVPERRWLTRNPAIVPTLITGAFSILSMIVLLRTR